MVDISHNAKERYACAIGGNALNIISQRRNQDEKIFCIDTRYPDPEWFASAISVEYTLRVISPEHVEALNNKTESYENYDKTDPCTLAVQGSVFFAI